MSRNSFAEYQAIVTKKAANFNNNRGRKKKGGGGKSHSPLSSSPAFLLLPYFNLHGMGSKKAGKSDSQIINKLRNYNLFLSA